MTRLEIMNLLRPLDAATSADHGGHEGGILGIVPTALSWACSKSLAGWWLRWRGMTSNYRG